MRERPIPFTGAMVRALLDGRKTQTRRVVKWRGLESGLNLSFNSLRVGRAVDIWVLESPSRTSTEWRCAPTRCPYGTRGDHLWVRETFYCDNAFYPDGVGVSGLWREVDGKRVAVPVEEQHAEMLAEDMYYRADGDPEFEGAEGPTPWRPSIHMPRWVSRITLEITSVRVERLQDISEADAIDEGLEWNARLDPAGPSKWRVYTAEKTGTNCPVSSYQSLWESINGAESWDANPWVWVVAFKRLAP